MKILKLFIKTVGWIFLAILIFLIITYISVTPKFDIPKTVSQDKNIPHITIDTVTFHAESFGPQDAPVVIAIHGGPGQDYRSLLPLKALADSFHVVFYDQRGTGLSPRVATSELSLESSLSDLKAIVDYYSPDKPVYLIGHSWGGMLASGFVAQNPSRVAKVVLAEPGFLCNETAQLFMERTKGMMPKMTLSTVWRMLKAFLESIKVEEPDEDAGIDYLMARIIGMSDVEDHPMAGYYCNGKIDEGFTEFWRLSMQASQAIRQTGMDNKGNFNIDLVSGVENYGQEVLFICGECNTITGEDIQRKHMSYFSHPTLKIIPNAGHNMISEKPDFTIDLIRTYFEK